MLEERELWPAEDGWLTFDLTATSNLWLDSPEHNLGLRLVLEDSRGETSAQRAEAPQTVSESPDSDCGPRGRNKTNRRLFYCQPSGGQLRLRSVL